MSIVKFDPIFPAKGFRSFFDEFFNRNIADVFGNDFTWNAPSINVIETDHAYKMEVAAPGLEKEDFEIKVNDGYLTVAAKKEKHEEAIDGKYTRREFNYTSFSRNFKLPEMVKAENITAQYTNGVLMLVLPKDEAAKIATAKVIEIQ